MSTPGRATTFQLCALNERGHVLHWQVEASSEAHARSIAERDGRTVLRCEAVRRSDGLRFLRPDRGDRTIDVVDFSQDLATMLEAGVTVKEGIDILARRANSSAARQVLERVNHLVSEGLRLSAALQEVQVFPALLIATVTASEQTGDVATALSRYAKHQQGLRMLKDRVVSACVYPLLLLVVGLLVVLMLLGVVVPRFAQVLDVQDRELPALSKMLMAWGNFAATNPSAVLLLLAAIIGGFVWVGLQLADPARRRKWLEALPGAGKVVRDFQNLQMYRTTAILTSRGIPVQNALNYSADYLGPTGLLRLQASLAAMREGQSLSAALSNSGLADDIARSMLAVAERSGALPEMLDRIADFYERSVQRKIDILSRLIEPVLMIVFGVLIGGIVLLMYLPIFDVASSVG